MSARSLWLVKTGQIVRDANGNEATEFGSRLEAGVVAAYARLTNNAVRSAPLFWHKSGRPFGASPDGYNF